MSITCCASTFHFVRECRKLVASHSSPVEEAAVTYSPLASCRRGITPRGPTHSLWPNIAWISLSKIRAAVVLLYQPGCTMDDMDYARLVDQLVRVEGTNLARYRDAEG